MPNYYKCSNGEKVSEATIKARLSAAYREYYLFEPMGICEGCNQLLATCTAHIVPKAICKQVGRTELIWNPMNWFRSCFGCNSIAENPSSEEIKNLKNYDRIVEVTRQLDPERYLKFNHDNHL